MRPVVNILCTSKPEKSDLSFAGMADFYGLSYEFIDINAHAGFSAEENGGCKILKKER